VESSIFSGMSRGNRDNVRSISVATAGSLPGSSPTSDQKFFCLQVAGQHKEVGDGAHDKMMMKASPGLTPFSFNRRTRRELAALDSADS
jgi:hypothetical protein